MKTIGMFEAKARLSEICDRVEKTREPVIVTRRGRPVVRILPFEPAMSMKERREAYWRRHGEQEQDDTVDFEAAPRSREAVEFRLDG